MLGVRALGSAFNPHGLPDSPNSNRLLSAIHGLAQTRIAGRACAFETGQEAEGSAGMNE